MKKFFKSSCCLGVFLIFCFLLNAGDKIGHPTRWDDDEELKARLSPAMANAYKFQHDLAKALSVDTLDVVFNDSHSTSKLLGEAMRRDSTMSESFHQVVGFGIRVITSEDKRIRLATWKMRDFGNHQYGYLFQYKIAPNRTRVDANLDRFFNLEMRSVRPIALRTLSRDIYLIEGKQSDDLLRIVGIDLSTNVLRKAYINNKSTFKESLVCTPEEYEKLYFNGVYLAPIEAHLADSLSQGRILRAWYRDANNRYHITGKSRNASVTFVTDLFDNGMGTDSILPIASVNVSMGARTHTFKSTNFDSRFVIEGMNVEAILKNDSLYNNPDKEGFPRIHYVCGRTSAVSYEKIIYTACSFDRTPTDDEYKQLRWVIEIDGRLLYLDPREHAGGQIKIEVKEEWEGKTISVVPFYDYVDLNVAQRTSVEKYKE